MNSARSVEQHSHRSSHHAMKNGAATTATTTSGGGHSSSISNTFDQWLSTRTKSMEKKEDKSEAASPELSPSAPDGDTKEGHTHEGQSDTAHVRTSMRNNSVSAPEQ